MSDTPRTDKHIEIEKTLGLPNANVVHIEFARELERETIRLRSMIERAMGTCSFPEYDKQYPERLAHHESYCRKCSEPIEGITMEYWYNGFSKIEKTEHK